MDWSVIKLNSILFHSNTCGLRCIHMHPNKSGFLPVQGLECESGGICMSTYTYRRCCIGVYVRACTSSSVLTFWPVIATRSHARNTINYTMIAADSTSTDINNATWRLTSSCSPVPSFYLKKKRPTDYLTAKNDLHVPPIELNVSPCMHHDMMQPMAFLCFKNRMTCLYMHGPFES